MPFEMYEFSATLLYLLCRHFSIQKHWDQPKLTLVLSGVGAVVHGPWGFLGTSQAVQHQTDAGLWCLEQTIPADHSCSSTASLSAQMSWEHIPLPSQRASCGCCSLWTWEQVRCKLQFRYKNSWHLLQSRWAGVSCASPGWPGRVVWWGFLCPAMGRSMYRALAGLLPGLCRINKTPKLCHSLTHKYFCVLSCMLFCLSCFFFSLSSDFNQIYSLAVFDQGRTV